MTRIHPLATVAACLFVLLVAACGDTQGQRIATGALGGAVAGQVISGDPLAGAAIGGVGGALIN